MAVYTKDITSARKFKRLSVYERGIIYGLLAEKRSIRYIARQLKRNPNYFERN